MAFKKETENTRGGLPIIKINTVLLSGIICIGVWGGVEISISYCGLWSIKASKSHI